MLEYYIIRFLYYYIIILLHYYIIILLYYYITIFLYYYIIVLLYYYIILYNNMFILLYYYIIILLLQMGTLRGYSINNPRMISKGLLANATLAQDPKQAAKVCVPLPCFVTLENCYAVH